VRVEEDPEAGIGAEGLRIRDEPITAAKLSSSSSATISEKGGAGNALRSGNAAVSEITSELLKMDVKDLHSEEARRLREARDIEDVLFSSVS
jgi:hypothetical protein